VVEGKPMLFCFDGHKHSEKKL